MLKVLTPSYTPNLSVVIATNVFCGIRDQIIIFIDSLALCVHHRVNTSTTELVLRGPKMLVFKLIMEDYSSDHIRVRFQ